ncbi:MAG: hypothetical protein KatS3mg022_0813 [Armatimonadota bacterium]|nr:MAG: hypothetical protein KatS3mg022_0813 [Armatimonadota bacterium]
MFRLTALAVIVLLMVTVAGINILEGQKMDEVEKLLKEFVALKPDEMPGFSTRGGFTFRTNTKWGVMSLTLSQCLRRTGTGIIGRDPTDIIVRVHYFPDRKIAYEAAIWMTWTQLTLEPPGLPEGSWTGLPIGEKSWYSGVLPEGTKPAPGLGSAVLVVWDDKLALEVEVHYQPIGGPKAKTAIFLPIAKEDLELGEWAARLILAKANLVLLGWRDLPTVRLVANGKDLEGKRTREGVVLVPVSALLKAVGAKVERGLGVIVASWGGKKVTTPIGARVLLVGKGKVAWICRYCGMGRKDG